METQHEVSGCSKIYRIINTFMQQYYTTLDLIDNNFVGTVFESSSNKMVYKTRPYQSQTGAMDDVNSFLDSSRNLPATSVPGSQTITNTAIYNHSIPKTGRRCCGR